MLADAPHFYANESRKCSHHLNAGLVLNAPSVSDPSYVCIRPMQRDTLTTMGQATKARLNQPKSTKSAAAGRVRIAQGRGNYAVHRLRKNPHRHRRHCNRRRHISHPSSQSSSSSSSSSSSQLSSSPLHMPMSYVRACMHACRRNRYRHRLQSDVFYTKSGVFYMKNGRLVYEKLGLI